MKYTAEQLFAYMDSGRPVKVKTRRGNVHIGYCWAYGSVQNEEEYGVAEDSLEIGPIGKGTHVSLYASEIEQIEFAD